MREEEAEALGWDMVLGLEEEEATEIERLRDIIHEMLDSNGHMCSGIHDIMEEYQVSEDRAMEFREAAQSLCK